MPKNLLQATRDVNKDFDVYKHFKDAVKSYLIGRGQEYFLICHDVVRVLDDYNPKLGLHWSADPDIQNWWEDLHVRGRKERAR